MRRPEARSAGIDRPDGVTRSFQVSLNNVEPSKSVLARNLFTKHCDRPVGGNKTVELWPKVSVISYSFSFSCCAERLAGAGTSPDRTIIRPPRKSKGVAPNPDPGEEVALGIAKNICRMNVTYAAFVYLTWRNVPGGNQVAKPLRRERLNFIVVGRHKKNPGSLRTGGRPMKARLFPRNSSAEKPANEAKDCAKLVRRRLNPERLCQQRQRVIEQQADDEASYGAYKRAHHATEKEGG